MKRLLLLLLFLPSLATAQDKIAEEWTTYCDNGVEKVRVAFTYQLDAVGFASPHSEWLGAYTSPCTDDCGAPVSLEAVRKALGNDTYKFTWEGWTRACLAGQVWRSAMMSYFTETEFGVENIVFFVGCADGPQTIVDELNCDTTPVATSTWGAIKALYQ